MQKCKLEFFKLLGGWFSPGSRRFQNSRTTQSLQNHAVSSSRKIRNINACACLFSVIVYYFFSVHAIFFYYVWFFCAFDEINCFWRNQVDRITLLWIFFKTKNAGRNIHVHKTMIYHIYMPEKSAASNERRTRNLVVAKQTCYPLYCFIG